jgi:hypothetical protein
VKEEAMVRSDAAIAASNLFLGTVVGAGVNQSLFVMPRWFASPPASLAEIRSGASFARFFMPLQVGALASLVSARVWNRRDVGRRKLLTAALGLYGAMWASTAAWFAPEIIRLGRDAERLPASEIARRGQRWMTIGWARHAALATAWVLTVAALERRHMMRRWRR